MDLSLEEVEERTTRRLLSARPVNEAEPTSPWLTARPATLSAVEKAVGPSAYQAHEGVNSGGANGVYWLRVLERRPDGLLLVENLHDVGKSEVKKVQALVEADLVYPLLRGRDVCRWRTEPSASILLPQSREHQREGIPESILRTDFPYTYAYLKEFEELLAARADRRYYPEGSPFYTMRNVAESVEEEFLGSRIPVTQHVVTLVPFTERLEAHYFCALVNTGVASLISASYSTSKSFGTPHVLEHVAIPKFEPSNPLHRSVASLSPDGRTNSRRWARKGGRS
jgi:hypothetical protein